MKAIAALLLIIMTHSIDQNCPCPTNSHCLSNNNMCACDSNFIGNCSTSAQTLNASPIAIQLDQNKVTYLQVDPTELDHYIEFSFSICPVQ